MAIEVGVLRLLYVMSIYCIAINPCSTAITTMGYPTLQTVISLAGICGFRTVWMQFIYGTSFLPASIGNVIANGSRACADTSVALSESVILLVLV